MSLPTAARGVSNVIVRCEAAKESGYLDLSECMLMYIADAIYLVLKGYDITTLSLRGNELKKFPKKMVDKFPNMKVVNCDHNAITEIPEEVGAWNQMRGLNAANNKLSSIPEAIFSWTDLGILDLSGNQIEEVDVDRLFESLPRLVMLNLAENSLREDTKEKLRQSKPEKLKMKL